MPFGFFKREQNDRELKDIKKKLLWEIERLEKNSVIYRDFIEKGTLYEIEGAHKSLVRLNDQAICGLLQFHPTFFFQSKHGTLDEIEAAHKSLVRLKDELKCK